jgi:hypothetical protein
MTDNITRILRELRYENLSSLEISKRIGISQPTVSRCLKSLSVIKIGGGRSSAFALIENEVSDHYLYQANENHLIAQIGKLYQQPEGRTLLIQEDGYKAYNGIPFYLFDALPSGFLGSIVLHNIVENDPILSTYSQYWSDKQIMHYLTHYGHDLAGNFIVGKAMAEKATKTEYKSQTPEDYPEIALNINKNPDSIGSSIAGEQPKFTVFNGNEHLIIKYSPLISETNPVATRHRDLMICEHLALQTLQTHGIASAKSQIYINDRIYLEIKRFDRRPNHGRRGIVSLKMIDAEYIGLNSDWPIIGSALLDQKRINQNDLDIISTAYAFGKYIANSDMHNGNFSFFMQGTEIAEATPIYDMLPMAYMPKQGELTLIDIKPPHFIDVSANANQQGLVAALDFWQKVQKHNTISNDFKIIAKKHHKALKQFNVQ